MMAESKIEPLCPVRFRTSNGELYDIDWRDVDRAFERDPDGRTVPHGDLNVLLLAAEDCVTLWMWGIGF